MKPQKISDEPLGFTVDGILAIAGGKGLVSRRLGVTIQSVSRWGRRIPARHARTIAIMAGLPLEIVRPDLAKTPVCLSELPVQLTDEEDDDAQAE